MTFYWENLVLGGFCGGLVAYARYLWVVARARRDAADTRREVLKVARGWGRCSGRVMRQNGDGCPNAWPSNDPELDAFNKGAREGWGEMEREMRDLIDEAEQIARGAA